LQQDDVNDANNDSDNSCADDNDKNTDTALKAVHPHRTGGNAELNPY